MHEAQNLDQWRRGKFWDVFWIKAHLKKRPPPWPKTLFRALQMTQNRLYQSPIPSHHFWRSDRMYQLSFATRTIIAR